MNYPQSGNADRGKDFKKHALEFIFSFALQNRLRIVGIRENEYVHVLWRDPDNEICPSKKHHT